jgi:hypothetical protein
VTVREEDARTSETVLKYWPIIMAACSILLAAGAFIDDYHKTRDRGADSFNKVVNLEKELGKMDTELKSASKNLATAQAEMRQLQLDMMKLDTLSKYLAEKPGEKVNTVIQPNQTHH